MDVLFGVRIWHSFPYFSYSHFKPDFTFSPIVGVSFIHSIKTCFLLLLYKHIDIRRATKPVKYHFKIAVVTYQRNVRKSDRMLKGALFKKIHTNTWNCRQRKHIKGERAFTLHVYRFVCVQFIVDKLMGRMISLQYSFFVVVFIYIRFAIQRESWSSLCVLVYTFPLCPFLSLVFCLQMDCGPLFFLPIVHNKEIVCRYIGTELTSTIEINAHPIHVELPCN